MDLALQLWQAAFIFAVIVAVYCFVQWIFSVRREKENGDWWRAEARKTIHIFREQLDRERKDAQSMRQYIQELREQIDALNAGQRVQEDVPAIEPEELIW